MSLFSGLHGWRLHRSSKSRPRSYRRPNPALEPLEERYLLATAANAASGLSDADASLFITGLYRDFLARTPAALEVDGWLSALNAGTSREQVAGAFTTSQEYQVDLIDKEYQTLLGRTPAAAEVASWEGALQAGLTQDQLDAAFLASGEYLQRQGGTAAAWLTALYRDVLQRLPDDTGLATWNQSLQAGASFAAIAIAFVGTTEAHQQVVTAAYHLLLQRDPDPTGLATFVPALNQGLSRPELLAVLAGSQEYLTLVLSPPLPAPVPVVVPPPSGNPGPPPTTSPPPQMTLVDFDGSAVPLNKAGDTYPNEYPGEGVGTVSLNTSDAITGNSLELHLTGGRFYLQFNPYDTATRGFARDYSADPAHWQFNTYNRLRFWIKLSPITTGLKDGGQHNLEFGTYVKQVANADPYSDETGGGHYYHNLNVPAIGQWTEVILNMHPDHKRGDSGSVDAGFLPNPTGEAQYNYFDTLTRFYIQEPYTVNPVVPADYLLDDFQFYQEPNAENDQQVYSLTGTYDAGANHIIVTWNRAINDNGIAQEVRYAFSDIHQTGWDAATPAPAGVIQPPGYQGYNGMVYDSTALPLAGHNTVYIAIKPQNSNLFTQIAIPLKT